MPGRKRPNRPCPLIPPKPPKCGPFARPTNGRRRSWRFEKKPSPSSHRPRPDEPPPLHQHRARPLPGAAALPGARGADQRVLCVANEAAAGGGPANAGLGNGLGQDLWRPPAPLWHPPTASCAAPERVRHGSAAPAHGHAPPGLACTPTQCLDPTHDQFHARAALRSQPAAGPTQTHPGQSGVGV